MTDQSFATKVSFQIVLLYYTRIICYCKRFYFFIFLGLFNFDNKAIIKLLSYPYNKYINKSQSINVCWLSITCPYYFMNTIL